MEINVQGLMSSINYEFGVDLMADTRERSIVEARTIFSKIMYTHHRFGYTKISRILNKNHATIYHYIKSFDHLYQYDPVFKERYMNVMNAYLSGSRCTDIEEAGKIMYENIVLSSKIKDLERKLSSPLHRLVDTIPIEKSGLIRERLELIIKMNC